MTAKSKTMPRVSVVIPTCNRAPLLRAAIDSVLGQTFRDFEIIVVDDASSDETPAMMRALANDRIRYLRQDSKKGQGATRNAGLRAARGSYVALLDDDDEWLPEKLQKQVDLLDTRPAGVGLVYTGFRKIDASSNRMIAEVRPRERGEVFDALARGNWIGTCSTVMLRRICFARAGYFDENLASGADYDMWVRVAKHFQVDCIEEPLVLYRVHGERISTNFQSITEGLEAQIAKHAGYFARDRKNYSRRYLNLGVSYCLGGNAKKGRQALRSAIRLNPLEIRHYYNFLLSLLGTTNFRRMKRRSGFALGSADDHAR